MNKFIILASILGALLCFGRCVWLLCQPPEHETEGCLQKPPGWWKVKKLRAKA